MHAARSRRRSRHGRVCRQLLPGAGGHGGRARGAARRAAPGGARQTPRWCLRARRAKRSKPGCRVHRRHAHCSCGSPLRPVDSPRRRLPRCRRICAASCALGVSANTWCPSLRRGDAHPRCSPQRGTASGAADAIAAAHGSFSPFVLFGVTGSGKTDVYLDVATRTIAAGGQVLLLVPEINLTPQLEQRVRAALPGASVVLLHSGLADGVRRLHWRAAATGKARSCSARASACSRRCPRWR